MSHRILDPMNCVPTRFYLRLLPISPFPHSVSIPRALCGYFRSELEFVNPWFLIFFLEVAIDE